MNFHEMLETSHNLAGFMLSGDLLLASGSGNDGRNRSCAVFGCVCFAYPTRQTHGGVDSVAVEIRVLDAQQRWERLLVESGRYVFECTHPGEDMDEYISAEPVIVPLPPLNSNDWSAWKHNIAGIFRGELERLQALLSAQGVATTLDRELTNAA